MVKLRLKKGDSETIVFVNLTLEQAKLTYGKEGYEVEEFDKPEPKPSKKKSKTR
jgi:hypothetical protein